MIAKISNFISKKLKKEILKNYISNKKIVNFYFFTISKKLKKNIYLKFI